MNQVTFLRNLCTKVIQLSTLRSSSVMFVRTAKTQSTFEGLTSIGFAADSSHGFGYDKEGNLVLVKPVENIPIQQTEESIEAQTQSILDFAEKADKSENLSHTSSDERDLD